MGTSLGLYSTKNVSIIFIYLNIVFVLAKIVDPNEMPRILHLMWVYNICQSRHVGIISM